ncbi:type IV pilus modification PilV family protein [Thalassotalea marina]|uniref:MSHA pilin protein MshD n=1 Tax=Thalassotalea marina TaxID=1673741 RepID=A0A919EII8_9GAMM|nr:type II secretion system protein [Thalassotalea marina]GHF82857.1 hypothetical protein GCM10017161_07610 [Thalassotalea marina]
MLNKINGFTLIETIVGIVVLSIAFAVLTSLIAPANKQSADLVQQVKASEIAQSLLSEIQNRAFDDRSDMSGGIERCQLDCSSNMGSESGESNRSQYDDVDDYNGFEQTIDGYQVLVTVGNDSDLDGNTLEAGDTDDNRYTAKLITVTVKTPLEATFVFATYRSNF